MDPTRSTDRWSDWSKLQTASRFYRFASTSFRIIAEYRQGVLSTRLLNLSPLKRHLRGSYDVTARLRTLNRIWIQEFQSKLFCEVRTSDNRIQWKLSEYGEEMRSWSESERIKIFEHASAVYSTAKCKPK